MNTLFIKSTLTLAIMLTIVSCGGSGGDTAGIGGSGFTSSGSITGFGSVFVNGVEFETDSATFDIDGDSDGTQDDLAIGMVVSIYGNINADGITGTATSISFDDQLQGPVSAINTIAGDDTKLAFSILGVTVIVDSNSTTFDIDDDNLPANTVFNFDSIALDNNVALDTNVEVSGFFDTNGDIQATRIELKDVTFDNNSIVEIKGITTGLNGTTFNLVNFSGLIIDASAATLDDLPSGLANAQLVEVKGTYDAGSNTITANEVEAEDGSANDIDTFELEGIITGYTDINTPFTVNGITVDASNPNLQLEPGSLTLTNDLHVEVEGAIVNGVLIATEIELEGGNIKVHAAVTSVDLATNTFKVRPITGQPEITVTVTTGTQIEDDVNEIEPYTLTDIKENMGFVEVQGFDDTITGGIIANEIDVRAPDEIIVQGTIQTGSDQASNIVKVLGVEFSIIYPVETSFEDADENPLTAAEFFSAITLDNSLIKVKDFDANGIADEIDIK